MLAAHARRAHRRHPGDADVTAVRAALERAAGPTVAQAAAARLLGVSQTALARWIARDRVPVVMTAGGRMALPLTGLLDLLDEVAAHRSAGALRPLSAALRESPAAGTERAAPQGHRSAELRGLAYHRAVADRLDDEVVADALVRLRRWTAEGRVHPRYADAWERLLTGSRARLAAALRADDDEAAALRQSSPFAGTLSEDERRRVLRLA